MDVHSSSLLILQTLLSRQFPAGKHYSKQVGKYGRNGKDEQKNHNRAVFILIKKAPLHAGLFSILNRT